MTLTLIRSRWISLLLAVAATVAFARSELGAQSRLGPFDGPSRSVRSRDFDQRSIRIRLDLDWESQTITGRVQHVVVPFRKLDSIELDAVEMEINRVVQRGGQPAADSQDSELEFDHDNETLTIQLPQPAPAGVPLRLVIDYVVVKPRHGGHFVVPDEREPDQPKMFWTQSESEYARYWFPCLDSPVDRVESETIVVVPEQFMVLSNGTLQKKSKSKNGRRTWHWTQRKTHVPYLISIVAGDFEAYEQQVADIPVTSYVPRGRLDQAARSFHKTPAMLELFSQKIGYPYPWNKYTQICVDEYAWGGMEHTSATTLTQRTLHDERAQLDVTSDDLVAHELAHQWFGNLITCKDWAEIWLNESFATYLEVIWAEHDRGSDEAIWERHLDAESYKKEDRDRYRRPIVTYRYPDPDSVFDGHAYPKGACVLHMLRHVLGDALFWQAIQRYTHEHEFSVAETADFRTSIERATGQGLNWFFDQWLYHGGHPEYEVRTEYDHRDRRLQMTVRQTQKVDDLTPLFEMPVEIEIVTPSETIKRRIRVTAKSEKFSFDVAERPQRVLFDPGDWILKELDFKKPKREWINQLREEDHVMCRHRAAVALKEFSSDGEARQALITAAREDAFWGVRAECARQLAAFAGDDVRAALVEIARDDEHAKVRRAAVSSLKEFAHPDTNAAIRSIINEDRSYYVVAEALKTLVEIDPQNCRKELYAAVPLESHRSVILAAAAEGLAEIDDSEAADRFRRIIAESPDVNRRAAVLTPLAKLAPAEHEATLKLLREQLASDRLWYRMAAVAALGEFGNLSAIDDLKKLRREETRPRSRDAIDKAIERIRNATDADLEQRLEKLEKRIDELEETKG